MFSRVFSVDPRFECGGMGDREGVDCFSLQNFCGHTFLLYLDISDLCISPVARFCFRINMRTIQDFQDIFVISQLRNE